MLDTVGPELQVVNKAEKAITLKADENVTLTPDKGQGASNGILPISFAGLAKVKHLPSLSLPGGFMYWDSSKHVICWLFHTKNMDYLKIYINLVSTVWA